MKLSEAGAGDYWDDADRWIRNMFAEGQLTSTDWIYRILETGLVNPDVQHILPASVDPYRHDRSGSGAQPGRVRRLFVGE